MFLVLGAIAAAMAVRVDWVAARLWRRSGRSPDQVTTGDVAKVRALYAFAAALGLVVGVLLIVLWSSASVDDGVGPCELQEPIVAVFHPDRVVELTPPVDVRVVRFREQPRGLLLRWEYEDGAWHAVVRYPQNGRLIEGRLPPAYLDDDRAARPFPPDPPHDSATCEFCPPAQHHRATCPLCEPSYRHREPKTGL